MNKVLLGATFLEVGNTYLLPIALETVLVPFGSDSDDIIPKRLAFMHFPSGLGSFSHARVQVITQRHLSKCCGVGNKAFNFISKVLSPI